MEENKEEKKNNNLKDLSHQRIYYGAPGTGKSHGIKELIKDYNIDEKTQVFRTTFHPDSDYSTFVGAYKPTMKEVTIYHPQTGDKLVEDKIVYTFTPQSFLKAYIASWNALLEEQPKPKYWKCNGIISLNGYKSLYSDILTNISSFFNIAIVYTLHIF